MITPWPPLEARHHRATAIVLVSRHDHDARASALELDNCGACALTGRRPAGDEEDSRVAGPNYAGWARVLVEAGRTIPTMWAQAFARELVSDNQAYADALRRSIASFGTIGVQYHAFGCACERGSTCDKRHDSARCPCVQCVRLSLRAVAS